jgi:hypothetical protein
LSEIEEKLVEDELIEEDLAEVGEASLALVPMALNTPLMSERGTEYSDATTL